MKNAMNTQKFSGVKANVKTTAGSLSVSNIERLQRKIMHRRYEDEQGNLMFPVVKRINIGDSGEIIDNFYQTAGLSPTILAYGKLYTGEPQQLSVRRVKDEDTGEMRDGKPVLVGPNEVYRLYNEIVLINYRGAEAIYDTHKVNGIEIDGKVYYPVSGSNSMSKHSSVYFHTGEAQLQFEILNDLTGGLLSHVLDQFDHAESDDIANITGRVSIAATTPSLWPAAGRTGNLFYFNDSVKSAHENTIEEIDNDFRDGYAVNKDTFAAAMFTELAEETVTPDQARRMPIQSRIRGGAGKDNSRNYTTNQFVKEIKGMLALEEELQANDKDGKKQRCFCWINCKQVNVQNLSEKEIIEIAEKVDLIVDKDVMKWGKYIVGRDLPKELEVGIVNTNTRTSGHMGSQIAFKMNQDIEEGVLYFKALTQRQLNESTQKVAKIMFSKDKVQLNNSTYFNCLHLNPDKASQDKLLNNFKIRQLDTDNLSKIANLKQDVNSMYLRLVPEDSLLNDRKEVLGSRMATFKMPTGETIQVQCLEVYSSAWEREYRKMQRTLKANNKMTKEQKQEVLDNMRVSVTIKSPSQGPDEFEGFYYLLAEEIKDRNVTDEYLLFIEECPDGCIIIAQDNTVKRILAGSDFDGDDVTVIFCEFTMTEDGAIVTGLFYTDEEGNTQRVNCYTSIVLRKKARRNNIGIGCLIEYGHNNPIRYGVVAEEPVVTEEEEQEDYKALDINDLF